MKYDHRFDHTDRARTSFRGGRHDSWNLAQEPAHVRAIGTLVAIVALVAAVGWVVG